MSYLPKSQQAAWRRKLQGAYEKPTYTEAQAALQRCRQELRLLNVSAVASLDEGMEETLTLHRLGLFSGLGPASRPPTAWSPCCPRSLDGPARSAVGETATRSRDGSPLRCWTSNRDFAGSRDTGIFPSCGLLCRRRSEGRKTCLKIRLPKAMAKGSLRNFNEEWD